jgi:hypothetical protein
MTAGAPGLSLAAVAAVLGCAVLGLTACGGGDEAPPPVSAQDRSALEGLSDKIASAASENDPATFCAVVQPSLVDEAFGGRRGCIRVIRQALKENSRVLKNLDIEKITVQGEGAIVTFAQNPPGDVLFVRESGEWYLSLNDLALQRQGATGATGPG